MKLLHSQITAYHWLKTCFFFRSSPKFEQKNEVNRIEKLLLFLWSSTFFECKIRSSLELRLFCSGFIFETAAPFQIPGYAPAPAFQNPAYATGTVMQ